VSPAVGGGNAVANLVTSVASAPDNAKLHAQLGLAYLQKARNEADPSLLPRADQALKRSLELQRDDNLEAFVGMASLANARHDFSHSVKWSRRAIETNPYNASAYGLLGDAFFELGRVGAADGAYQKMVEVRPDVASYVRASYALQYHGRVRAAIDAMRLALQAAGPSGETAAWVRHQMGDIYATMRDNDEATRQNRIGISIAPGYVPPTVGLAESYIAKGRLEAAVEIMETAADELPSVEYMITLGDLYHATGRTVDAERQYREISAKLKEYRSNGVLPDADFIVFYADHGLRPAAAVREASAIYRDRRTAKTADALAWMLHSVGHDRQAWRYAREAIRSPNSDSSMLFHAGMIASSRGDDRAIRLMRRALKLDPTFSVLQAPIARRIADRG
jgi:tetratricopeptide (TPR) repeat protein